MPGIYDFLTTPLVPEAPVRRLQEQIDAPTLDRSPWEARARGFGAGALEGLRGLTSPLSLAGMVPLGRAASMAPRAVQGLSRAIQRGGPTLDLVEDAPAVAQAMPNMGAVDDMIGALRYNLAKIPGKAGPRTPPTETLGTQLAEFTPRGGEAAYNAARPARTLPADIGESTYNRMLQTRGGLASETGAITPEQAITGGVGAGLAAYGLPKAYQALRGLGSSLNQRYNPFQRFSDTVDENRQ